MDGGEDEDSALSHVLYLWTVLARDKSKATHFTYVELRVSA